MHNMQPVVEQHDQSEAVERTLHEVSALLRFVSGKGYVFHQGTPSIPSRREMPMSKMAAGTSEIQLTRRF